MCSGPQWKLPSSNGFTLVADSIHVWRAFLDLDPSELDLTRQHLSLDEIHRSERFHFSPDRDSFIASRGILRVILSQYLGINPKQIKFKYGVYGKPVIANELQKINLCFNVSHSFGLALYAITLDRSVGVDVEYIRSIADAPNVAKNFFSLEEQRELQSLPINRRERAFFRYWTRKEAYLKAGGMGLAMTPNPFNTSSVSETLLDPILINPKSNGSPGWSLMDFSPEPQYIAALIAGGDNLKIEFLDARFS